MIRRVVWGATAVTLTAATLSAAGLWILTRGLLRLDEAVHLNLDRQP